jgi:phospholipase/carboxylesterase
MAHGLMDDIVPLERAQHSKDLLLSQGYYVNWKTYSMGHSVCAEEIKDIGVWLQEIVNINSF